MPELRFGPRFVYAFLMLAATVGAGADMDRPYHDLGAPYDHSSSVGHSFAVSTPPCCSAEADTRTFFSRLTTVDYTMPLGDYDSLSCHLPVSP